MFKVMKKLLIIAGILGLTGFLIFGAGLSSYMRTGYKQVKKQLKSSIPIEFEIHRIEDLIEQITPEMKQVEQQVAEEQVSIVELKNEITHLQKLAGNKSYEVKVLRTSLSAATPKIQLGGLAYNRTFVESDLGRRLDNLKAMKSLIDTKIRLLTSREQSLDAARVHLVNFNSERTRLETMVQQLRTEVRELDSLHSACVNVKIDDSKLKQAQELAKKVQKSLDVKRKILENSGVIVLPKIQLKPISGSPRDICKEVDEFLSRDNGELSRPAQVNPSQKI